MDVQAAPPTYTPVGGNQPTIGNPPNLGQQVPGMTGGLPAQGGLSVLSSPLSEELMSQYADGGAVHQAEQVRQMGRGEDSVLMHVTPHELQGLQALALAHGGSLTINPHTGLPEAGFLGSIFKKLLPTLIGVGMNFVLPGSGLVASLGGKAATAGLLTGLGGLAMTGSLKKGLMAGLGAYGGASLAGGIQGAIKGAPVPGTTQSAALGNTTLQGAPSIVQSAAPEVMKVSAFNPATAFSGAGQGLATSTAMLPSSTVALTSPIANAATGVAEQLTQPVLKKGLAGFAQGFANTAKGTMGGILGKAAVPLAIAGAMQPLSSSGGSKDLGTGAIDNSYQGPYYAEDRQQIMDPEGPVTSKQRRHFATSMPAIYNTAGQMVAPGSMTPQGTPILRQVARAKPKKGQPMYDFQMVPYMGGPAPMLSEQDMGYAHGGVVHMEPGSFVYPARETAEHGGGDTIAGQKELAKLGGIPIRGPGDGTSDSIKASIGGRQEARVATGEVLFPPEAVRRIGGGNEKRGTQKLYAMMHKAEQSRKKASRGADGIKLRKGLA